MIRKLSSLAVLVLWTGCCALYAQNERNNNVLHPTGSIGLTYELPSGYGVPVYTAVLNSHSEAMNGTSFNGGSAITLKVHSDRPYVIRIAAENAAAPNSGNGLREVDIRDYIYYKVVENATGGFAQTSWMDIDGDRIGSEEKTLISNCPPTEKGAHGEDIDRVFSLIFKIKAGYSVPPGNYVTNLMLTASYE